VSPRAGIALVMIGSFVLTHAYAHLHGVLMKSPDSSLHHSVVLFIAGVVICRIGISLVLP
jgi:hypothetical protein